MFINTVDSVSVMHPLNPALEGRNMADLRDAAGNFFVRRMSEIGREGQGYLSYTWQNPGEDVARMKLSYIEGFAPWGWAIGTGVYIDDIEAMTARARTVFLGVAALATAILAVIGSRSGAASRSR